MLVGNQSQQSKTILIIDDEHLNFFALAEVLKSRGYRSLSALNTAEAISVLSKTPETAAILMDIMMPGIDGFEATKAIKNMPQFANIPIIVVTALTTSEEKQKALAAGANAFMTKPVDIDKLEELLRQLV